MELPVNGVAFTPESAPEPDRIVAEQTILDEFGKAVDRAGLHFPADPNWLSTDVRETFDYWPPDKLIAALALGQHYGVPTRLLDWTRQGRIPAG